MSAINFKPLINSDAYRKIISLEKRHNVFNAFKFAIDENAYSRFLAYLLDSTNDHGLKTKFFSRLIRQVRGIQNIPSKGFQSHATFNWPTQDGRFIDILVTLRDIHDYSVITAVGIENKTTSNESIDQLCDYQDSMTRFFHDIPIAIIFLTPEGRKPSTAYESHKHVCPVYSLSYKNVAKTCWMDFNNINPDVGVFLKSFGRYIETDLVEGSIVDIAKKNVLDLVKNPKHKVAIETICKYAPFTHPTIRNLVYESLINKLIEYDVGKVTVKRHYPQYSARPREFNFSVGDLNDILKRRSIKIYYMLDAAPIAEPDIGDDFVARCMIHDSGYDNSKGKSSASNKLFDKLAKLSNLPKSQSRDRQWGPWYCLYSGSSYKLIDLAERDTEGLSKALVDCVAVTFKKIRKAIINL